MRKKSHIELAKYLATHSDYNHLNKYSASFMWGSILPDCVFSFITKRHTIDETFDLVEEEIQKLVLHLQKKREIDRWFCRHLGIVCHYIADYFTFPHNKNFNGSIKIHCSYENELKLRLKSVLRNQEIALLKKFKFESVDFVTDYIKKIHAQYLSEQMSVDHDILYITSVTQNFTEAILSLFDYEYTEYTVANFVLE